jgi:hypothetical protein
MPEQYFALIGRNVSSWVSVLSSHLSSFEITDDQAITGYVSPMLFLVTTQNFSGVEVVLGQSMARRYLNAKLTEEIHV